MRTHTDCGSRQLKQNANWAIHGCITNATGNKLVAWLRVVVGWWLVVGSGWWLVVGGGLWLVVDGGGWCWVAVGGKVVYVV